MKDDKPPPSLDERLRNWGQSNRGAHDPIDAEYVTRAWETLAPRNRDLLRMVYLWHASREVVCRRLKIARHPRQHFDLELHAARSALARALAEDEIQQ
ncbi:hypothetical protein CJO66_22125 [Burkholderia ubonensis]|uniref:hypothetical protein n=1 Tax=Burkholderia ubonensis TaxID=101571 RepID=UPI000BA59EFF|nr:hypothetical protein [Burkholderia ubonensis]PAK12558.1 hypothetical protein CJO66_22125 [Burkholderia ubonensis]RQP87508.1 hypothetical protein DF009_31640 [Burkholderia ubonensis]